VTYGHGDLSDQIARIEVDIEELAKTLDTCRKAMLLSRLAIAAIRLSTCLCVVNEMTSRCGSCTATAK
jgi:hypothetical protein